MTAPVSPHPLRLLWLFCLGMIGAVIALPFARRGGVPGWLSLAVLSGVAVLLWASFVIAATRAFLAWHRDRPVEPDDPKMGECYTEHGYNISWDHEAFSLRTPSGQPVVQVPLPRILDVLDLDALFLEDDVTVSAPGTHVAFPKSRSARFKMVQLIACLADSCLEMQREMERRRVKYLRQLATWLPVSLGTAAILVLLSVLAVPEPVQIHWFWVLAGMAYGMAWYWVLRRFAWSLACFFGARKLQSLLRSCR